MDYVFGFLILLGILIFIHEFGHFIVAKACGVRVETFSIGMGKKILRFQRGDTEYALSVIPVGGYVKLTGQDPREEIPPELEAQSFRHKALWKRTAIVLAGPMFNAALAIIIMTGVYASGVPSAAPSIERLLPGSAAMQAGFRSGDRVVEIIDSEGTSHRIRELGDLESIVARSVAKPLRFVLERSENGHTEKVTVLYTPELGLLRDSNLGVVREQGAISGVEYLAAAPVVTLRSADSWAAQRQLPSAFWVEELRYSEGGLEQSLKINNFTDLESAWKKASQAQYKHPTGQILLKGHKVILSENSKGNAELPEQEAQTFTLAWTLAKDHAPATLEDAGLLSSELSILEVKDGSPAAKLGLKPGDVITQLNGAPVLSFNSFRYTIQKLAKNGQALKLNWLRDGKNMDAEIHPEVVAVTDPLTETKKNQFQIGAAFLALPAAPTVTTVKADNPIDALSLGVQKSYQLSVSMLKSFYLLLHGDISPKTLGGPVLIGKIAGESFREGPIKFFRTMAYISLNLFILNLFPIPVLDGGHLILYIVEAVRRRPLSTRIVEAWSTTGFVLLMGLVAVVFFNDLSRLGLFKFFSS